MLPLPIAGEAFGSVLLTSGYSRRPCRGVGKVCQARRRKQGGRRVQATVKERSAAVVQRSSLTRKLLDKTSEWMGHCATANKLSVGSLPQGEGEKGGRV